MEEFVQSLRSNNSVITSLRCNAMLIPFPRFICSTRCKGVFLQDMNCLFHRFLKQSYSMSMELILWALSLTNLIMRFGPTKQI
ncbi:hypothetical protein MTR67_023100 [Solanum verrucosum]|uniref:Uncharacterized protein n=1 Tax=Solanum verrucosum TaxID=315347 RepID=A0AAF0QZ31_SOLVR|nr:hypothetical protein MTR67_023100 [Solanum verrucosum]